MPRLRAPLAAAVLVASHAGPALAQAPAPAPQASPAEGAAPPGMVEFSAGARALLGGNYLSEPSGIPGGYEGLGFAGDGGGFAWSAGLYGEARIKKYLGLELDLARDSARLEREVTYNGVLKVNEGMDLTSFRLTLLAKLVVPAPFGRFWLGLGPELVLSEDAEAANEIVESPGPVPPADEQRLREMISARESKPMLLALGFGLVFHLGDRVEIPLDFRAMKSTGLEDAWEDRVQLRLNGTNLVGYSVQAENAWEFRMGLGVGARF